jgi:hypothetical protein
MWRIGGDIVSKEARRTFAMALLLQHAMYGNTAAPRRLNRKLCLSQKFLPVGVGHRLFSRQLFT